MKGKVCLIAMLMVIVSCMATRFSSVWVDETYEKGSIKDILVVAIFPIPERGKMIEDEMARQLRSRGINTLLRYVEFPGKEPSKDEVMSRLNKLGINAVLVTKFIDRRLKNYSAYPDNYNTLAKQWDTGTNWGEPPSEPYEADPQNYAVTETSLYDVKAEKVVWSALSETWIVGTDSRLTSSFVSAVLKKLAEDKFVR